MTGIVYGTDQAITIAESIHGHTLFNAFLDLEESKKDSIALSKLEYSND